MAEEKRGLLDFTQDVQNQPELRTQAEDLLKKMQEKNWSHPVFCAEMLKIARKNGYLVTSEEVMKLRSQKDGYSFTEDVKQGKGQLWPFDYSYCVNK